MPEMTKAEIEQIVDARVASHAKTVERQATVSALDPLTVSLAAGEVYVTLTDPSLVVAVGDKVHIDWVGTGYAITGLLGAPIAPVEGEPQPPAPHTHLVAQVTDFTPHTHVAPQPEQQASDDSVQTKSSAGTWASGSPGQQVTFVAPESGKVVITTSARARAASNNILSVSFVLHEGTGTGGTQVLGEAVVRGQNIWVASAAGSLTNPYLGGADRSHLVTGLTPGDTYTTQLRYDLAVANTVEIRARVIRVSPVD
jgi:hypothetical protein